MSNPVRVFSKLPVCFSIASYRHSLSRLRLASRADRAVHSFSRLGLPRLRPAHRNPSLRFCTEKLNPFFVCTSLTMTLIYPVFWALKSSSCSTSANLLSWLHLHHSQTRSACMSESSYDENKNIIMHSVGLSPFFLGEMSMMLLVCNHEVAYLSII